MTMQNESARTEQSASVHSGALTYTVYATREGLVGHRTANEHVIQPNDHFVALPSRRALSPKGSHRYSVRVRNPKTGLSEVAPVWEVGPWNTHDDYWNPSSQREAWRDLPQGMPQAQAAYQHGYHGGNDGGGRRVPNPAGIDLADGTFAAIGMTDNGWVEVTFLWTGHSVSPITSIRSVKQQQQAVNGLGYKPALVIDNQWGPKTEAGVKWLQKKVGTPADGQWGKNTEVKYVAYIKTH